MSKYGICIVEVALKKCNFGGETRELLGRAGGFVTGDGEESEICVSGKEGSDGGTALFACGTGDEKRARHFGVERKTRCVSNLDRTAAKLYDKTGNCVDRYMHTG